MSEEATANEQDLKEELNNLANEDENGLQNGAAEGEEEEENGEGGSEEGGESEEEGKKDEIDKDSPLFKAGQKHMQKIMQDGLNRRISKEVSKRKVIENQFSTITSELAEIKKSIAASVPKEKPPQLKDYETEEDWAADFFEFQQKQTKTPSNGKAKPKAEAAGGEGMSQAETLFMAKESEYGKTHPNYIADVQNLKPFLQKDPELKEIIFDTDPAVADYLSKNLDVMDQLTSLSPGLKGRSIALIEMQFKRGKPPRRANKKPAPAEQQQGTNSGKGAFNGTQADYNKRRWEMDHPK